MPPSFFFFDHGGRGKNRGGRVIDLSMSRLLRSTLALSAALCLAGSIHPATAMPRAPSRGSADLAIVGGTIIDVDNRGRSDRDRQNKVLLIRHGRFVASGQRLSRKMPRLDARGKFIVPGLIDGFGSLRSQAFADAYLYEGVTSVVVNRAPKDADGEQVIVRPVGGPRLILSQTVSETDRAGIRSIVGRASRRGRGIRAAMAGVEMAPSALRALVGIATANRMAVMGEFARTSYADAAATGVRIFLRSDHYLTTFALPEVLRAYAAKPISPAAGPAYRAACDLDPADAKVAAFAQLLKRYDVAMMPVLSIEATADDVDIPNPWTAPAAAFFAPGDLDDPVDPNTGARPFLLRNPNRVAALQACARNRQRLDGALYRGGVRYLAGSGAPAFGIMPGSGLHQELKLLQRIGLTPREALAAATSGLADVFGWHDIGNIAPGRLGDLLVLDRDPRSDVGAIDSIRAVVIGGRIIDRSALLACARRAVAACRSYSPRTVVRL